MSATKVVLPRTRGVLEAQGFSSSRIDAFCRGLDADCARRLEELQSARPTPRRSQVPKQVVAVEAALARRGVRMNSVTKGRPVKIEIEAEHQPVFIGEDHADWYCRLRPDHPVTAAVYYASERSSGNAPFNVTGFLDSDLPAAKRLAQPDIYFFVLLSKPPRIWVLARGALRDIYKEIRDDGKSVDRFASPKPGYLRLMLPETKLGFDIDQCVYVEDGEED